jgi:transposase-like protein
VIRIFPNEDACLRLISALAMETNLEWMERVYLKMDETTVSEEERVEVA